MMDVVGRERDLAAADLFLHAAAQQAQVLVLEGDAGIGKTTVWRTVVRRAADRGFRVLTCRGAEAEAKVALLGLVDLLHDIPAPVLARLPRPQRAALEAALARAAPREGATDRRTLVTAVRTLLTSLVEESPILVGVDDVHWLDAPTTALLESAARRLPDAPIGWLVARRVDEPAGRALDHALSGDVVSRLALTPLTIGALHHVLKQNLDRPITRSTLVRIHRACDGNPLYALEIARELDASGGSPDTVVPDSLRQLISRRLRRLPQQTRDALLMASMLSHPTTELVDEQALEPAEEAGLVHVGDSGRIELRHPLYAWAVYNAAAAARRRELHRHLAGVVADPEERARHLAAATTMPEETIAAELEVGAADARSRGAWDSAAELLERARQLTPPGRGDDADRRAITAAADHLQAGDRDRARALLDEVLTGRPERANRSDAWRLRGLIAISSENVEDAVTCFQRARDAADDLRTVAMVEMGLAYCSAQRQDFNAGVTHSQQAVAAAEACGDHELIGSALGFRAMFDFLAARGLDWSMVARAAEMGHQSSAMPIGWRPAVIEALLLLYVGRHAEARERLTAIRADAVARGDESDLAFVLLWLSWLETRAGRLADAEMIAEEAVSLALLTQSHSTHAWALAQRGYVRALAGDVEAARLDCREAAGLATIDNALTPIWEIATSAAIELSVGDGAAAWAACEPAVAAIEASGLGEPVVAFFLPDAIEALVAVGDLDRAERLINQLEQRGRELDRPVVVATGARCRGALLAARRDLDGALAAFDRALDAHAAIDLPIDEARALLAKGVVARRARKRALARECIEKSLTVLESVGAKGWATRAKAELGRVGLRRSLEGELTESERRVAQLTAEGRSNREVAAELFVSPKTVEAHLARVYRKLGISSRAELGARMSSSHTVPEV